MAKIKEEIIAIKVSKLLRDSEQETGHLLADDAYVSIEAVIQELAGSDVLVEIIKE